MKKTAILLATYNGEKYLAEMLDSLLAQERGEFTCYIHDDGSLDGTKDLVWEYVRRYPGRFVWLSGEDAKGSGERKRLGARDHFFYMISRIEADAYFFADQDDVWLPQKVEKTLAKLQAMEDESGDVPLAVFTDMTVVDENKNEIAPSFLSYMGRDADYHSYTEILIDNPASGAAMCINRACRDLGMQILHPQEVPMHDVWFLIVAAVFGKVDAIKEPMVLYRQHKDNELGASTEGDAQKAGRNLRAIWSGRFLMEKRTFYEEKQHLAKEVLSLPGIPKEKQEVLEDFVELHSMPLVKKVAFLRKNGFRRARHSFWIWLWL